MADVRSLLKNERNARRVQHKHASYTATGTLICNVCHLQLKSESLWDGHLRSPGHILRQQKSEQQQENLHFAEPSQRPEASSKKRKASDEDEEYEVARKRTRPDGVPNGFFDANQETSDHRPSLPSPTTEIQIPSRPATPSKPPLEVLRRPEVDEDEWAAFEADIAAADIPEAENDTVISAPAITTAELAARSVEETNAQRKAREEAELEGEKEDAARKLEEELEEMESLEQRVKRLREKREELRKRESLMDLKQQPAETMKTADPLEEEDDEDDDDEDEDDWDSFRMR